MRARTGILAAILIAATAISGAGQGPAAATPAPETKPDTTKPQQKKPGTLIEIVSTAPTGAKLHYVAIEPADCDYRIYDGGRTFVTTALSNTGLVRILEIEYQPASEGKPETWKQTYHQYSVGLPPAPPTPAPLPTAALRAEPATLTTAEAAAKKPVTLTWETSPPGIKVTLEQGDGQGPKDVDSNGSAVVLPQRTSQYTLAATDAEGRTTYSQARVTVSDKPPPDTIPPGPVLQAGLRVLIVYDAETKQQLPRGQLATIDSLALREWLKTVCTKTPDGTPEARIYDVEGLDDIRDDQPNIKAMAALPRTSLPWLVVSPGKGTTGYSGPLPADEAATKALIERYR